jgi:dTDP-4-amino-4,6-dideoxygalactose transaminase
VSTVRIAEIYSPPRHATPTLFAGALASGLDGSAPIVRQYESRLASYFSATFAHATSSGTAAVGLAIDALRLCAGDAVIVPPTAPLCSVVPLLQRRLVPVFCDLAPDSFGLSTSSVTRALMTHRRIRAVIEVPMWGYPTPTEDLRMLCEECGLHLVLDLAHGYNVRSAGRPLQCFGHISCFSTHESKYFATGEGGFVLTSHPDLERALVEQISGPSGSQYRSNGLQAALGLDRLSALDEEHRERQRLRAVIRASLPATVEELPVSQGQACSGYAFVLRTRTGTGASLVEHFVAHGIPSDIHKYRNRPLYRYPLLHRYAAECKNAERLLNEITTLPLHPNLTSEELAHIVDTARAFVPDGATL